jgi:hypothetical protein
MKKILLLSTLATALFATPAWYYKLPNTKPNFYIGYGDGANESEAKQNALGEIASQIHTKIENETIQNKKSSTAIYEKEIQMKSVQKTKANLSDFEVIKTTKEDGVHFVAIAYENISNSERFVGKVKQLGGNITPSKTPTILEGSVFAKKLYEALGQKIDFEVIRDNKAWFVRYKNASQHIDEREFSQFLITVPNEKLTIVTNKRNNILYDGDEFFFNIKSQNDGYVSILTVYEDGTVGVLLENTPFKKNTQTSLPDKKYTAIPTAGLLESGKATFDMYVVIRSDVKLALDIFSKEGDENDERNKNFGELVEFLKNKEFATLRVDTKPRTR